MSSFILLHNPSFPHQQTAMAETLHPRPSLIFFFLTLLPLSSSATQPFQFLDVSSSLRLTRQVFSAADRRNQQLLQTTTTNYSYSLNSLSFPLHSRSSLPFSIHHNHNYTSLTLSRLSRDHARVKSIHAHLDSVLARQQLESPITSGVRQGSGEYFAEVGVGSPAKHAFMVVDTGSDIMWLQCQPCVSCYQQTDPVFNPAGSSTYRPLSCDSEQCNALHVSGCEGNGCLYEVDYGDGSRTVGSFVTETVSFGRTGSVPNVALGCGHDNEGLFAGSAGLLGMGAGKLSLPTQVGATSFSYCLVNRDSTGSSTLEFNTAQPADSVVAPLLTNSFISTYRYVALTGFNVGGHPVQIPESLFEIGGDGRGGVIVDSGTAVSRLRSDVYGPLRDTFKSMSRDLPAASGFSLFDTCYDLSSMTSARVPTLALIFSGGKTLELPPTNYLIPVSSDGKFCFAFAPTQASMSIIGNVQQQGTRVSYNLANKYVGFSPHKC